MEYEADVGASKKGTAEDVQAIQLWTSDSTPEKLGPLLAANEEAIAWMSAEAGLFDLLGGRYSRGVPNLDLILKSFAGEPERVDRNGRPSICLRYPRLTIGLTPQPDVLRGLASQPGFRGRGLLGRFMYLLPPSNLGYRVLAASRPGAYVDPEVNARYQVGIRAMLGWPPPTNVAGSVSSTHILELSNIAYEAWLEFARRVEMRMRPGGDMYDVTDLGGKLPGSTARIAAVLHAIEQAPDHYPWHAAIPAAAMESAVAIASVMLEHGIEAMSIMGADRTVASARVVWEWLRRGHHSDATVRDAHQALRTRFPRKVMLEEALGVLAERGYIRLRDQVRRPGAGRSPSPHIVIRPSLAAPSVPRANPF